MGQRSLKDPVKEILPAYFPLNRSWSIDLNREVGILTLVEDEHSNRRHSIEEG